LLHARILCRPKFVAAASLSRGSAIAARTDHIDIDDDESMRCAVKSLVTSLGLDAYTFASAEAFLQSPHLDDTSCVITDLQMPGLNGVELQKSLLAQGRRIPIIFVTAFPEERLRARAMEAGALGFLSKPFESETVITLIDQAIEAGRKT